MVKVGSELARRAAPVEMADRDAGVRPGAAQRRPVRGGRIERDHLDAIAERLLTHGQPAQHTTPAAAVYLA
jgi:hypothetical protein